MKMTLPFKPHVLALICSAGLCAASTGLYIKSRTVEAPVEPQSTQLAASDVCRGYVSCNGFRTSRNTRRRQIRIQHCTNRSMGRARRAVSRRPTFAGADGINLSDKRCSSSAMVAR